MSSKEKKKAAAPLLSTPQKKQIVSSGLSVAASSSTFARVQISAKLSPKGKSAASGSKVLTRSTRVPGAQTPKICVRCAALGGFWIDEPYLCNQESGGPSCAYCYKKKVRCEEMRFFLCRSDFRLIGNRFLKTFGKPMMPSSAASELRTL